MAGLFFLWLILMLCVCVFAALFHLNGTNLLQIFVSTLIGTKVLDTFPLSNAQAVVYTDIGPADGILNHGPLFDAALDILLRIHLFLLLVSNEEFIKKKQSDTDNEELEQIILREVQRAVTALILPDIIAFQTIFYVAESSVHSSAVRKDEFRSDLLKRN